MALSTVSGSLVAGRWTVEYRTTLHLLHTKFTFSENSPQKEAIVRIFRNVFATDMQTTHPKGIRDFTLLDDYISCNNAGRSSMYKTITAKPVSDGQAQLEQKLMLLLSRATQHLGLAGEVHETATDGSAPQPVIDPASQSDKSDGAGSVKDNELNGKVRQEASANWGVKKRYGEGTSEPSTTRSPIRTPAMDPTDSSHEGAETQHRLASEDAETADRDSPKTAAQPTDEPAVADEPELMQPMVHYGDFLWSAGIRATAAKVTFVEPGTDLYKLGGKVYRNTSMVDGWEEDFMICDKASCERCKDLPGPPASTDPGSGSAPSPSGIERLNGLPFVHTYDCFSMPGIQYWYFAPRGAWPYRDDYPKSAWRTTVAFEHRGSREGTVLGEVMMCDADQCERCKAVESGEIKGPLVG